MDSCGGPPPKAQPPAEHQLGVGHLEVVEPLVHLRGGVTMRMMMMMMMMMMGLTSEERSKIMKSVRAVRSRRFWNPGPSPGIQFRSMSGRVPRPLVT